MITLEEAGVITLGGIIAFGCCLIVVLLDQITGMSRRTRSPRVYRTCRSCGEVLDDTEHFEDGLCAVCWLASFRGSPSSCPPDELDLEAKP